MDQIRFVLVIAVSIAMGLLVAAAIGWLVGRLWPVAQWPVTVIIGLWWIWTGSRYAVMRARHRRWRIM